MITSIVTDAPTTAETQTTRLPGLPSVIPGPRWPVEGTPRRREGSIRRTTSVDGAWTAEGALVLTAHGRDLLTAEGGQPAALVEQGVRVETGPDMVVRSLVATPPLADLTPLEGLALRGSLRKALSTLPGLEADRANLLFMLLDDIVATSLISGYARQRAIAPGGPSAAYVDHMADICAGWTNAGQMVTISRKTGYVPLVIGPSSRSLDDPRDPLAWHDLAEPVTGTVRRRRRTDLVPSADGFVRVDAMFRDVYGEPDGTQSVLHEYSVVATVDRDSGCMTSVVADPRVLPATECPSAASSAALMVGAPVADLRALVRRDLRGTGTCTHLNDLLRSLADVPVLLRWADGQPHRSEGTVG
jgi:hypothetical protein